MIQRIAEKKLIQLSKKFISVAVVGPRQSGKTTLVKKVFPNKPYISLENPDLLLQATEDPRGFLAQFPNGAILDEAQRAPQLFSYLQEILDNTKKTGLFILSGSNNFLLQQNISQSLSGRIAYIELLPFNRTELFEVKASKKDINSILLKGMYPSVITKQINAQDWFANYVRTYIERDVRMLKNISNLATFERMLRLCAGRAGQLLNLSNLSIEVGVDIKTIQAWLSILQASYIVYLLPPYFKNYNKRIVKTPKLYFYDTGLLSFLLGISTKEQMVQHAQRGSIFENFIVNEFMKERFNEGKLSNLFFWRDNTGYEVDIVQEDGNNLLAYEIKSSQTIQDSFFKNLEFFRNITANKSNTLIYAGDRSYNKSNDFRVISWKNKDY